MDNWNVSIITCVSPTLAGSALTVPALTKPALAEPAVSADYTEAYSDFNKRLDGLEERVRD